MVREWMLWRKRSIWWICLAAVIMLAYLGFFTYEEYDTWVYRGLMLDTRFFSTPEEREFAFDILWKLMVGHMVDKLFDYTMPVLFICLSFGRDLYQKRMEKMRLAGMKLSRGYFMPFLFTFLLSCLLVLFGFGMQIYRLHAVWEGHLAFGDIGFFLRVLLYEWLLVFCVCATAQLACCLFSKIHYLLSFAGGIAIFWAATLPGKLLARVLAGKSYKEAGGFRMVTYFFHDINQGELELDYLPKVLDPSAVRLWGRVIMVNYLVIGVIFLILGYFLLQYMFRRRKE